MNRYNLFVFVLTLREQGGVWVIEVNEEAGALKTENATRLVPLHSSIRESVVEFARKATGENLWGLTEDATGRYSGALTVETVRRPRTARSRCGHPLTSSSSRGSPHHENRHR